MAPRPRESSLQTPLSPTGQQEDGHQEAISEDHVCPVCHLLLFRPVRTHCNHTLCESCMAHWAHVSVTSQMTIVSLDDEPSIFEPLEIEAKCPMCRTPTTASLDARLAGELGARYPLRYAERQAEEQTFEVDRLESAIETLTLYIGNRHRLVMPQGGSSNWHEWTFFVRPSRTDIIEEVQILLVSIFTIILFPPNSAMNHRHKFLLLMHFLPFLLLFRTSPFGG